MSGWGYANWCRGKPEILPESKDIILTEQGFGGRAVGNIVVSERIHKIYNIPRDRTAISFATIKLCIRVDNLHSSRGLHAGYPRVQELPPDTNLRVKDHNRNMVRFRTGKKKEPRSRMHFTVIRAIYSSLGILPKRHQTHPRTAVRGT